MTNQKKIGIFSGFYLPFLGGIERYTSRLSTELVRQGYDVTIITTNHENLASYEVDTNGVSIYRLPSRKIFQQRYPIIRKNNEYKRLMNEIVDENFDYYICNTRFQLTSLLGAKLAKKCGHRALVIEHGSSHFSVDRPVFDVFGAIYEHLLTALLRRYTNLFYGVSYRCVEWLKHFHIKARGVFYNSVDSAAYDTHIGRPYKHTLTDKLVITYAGRILREKGVEMLLQAYVELRKEYDNIVLVIAGDGPLLAEMKTVYSSPDIYFEGKLGYDDMMNLMARTDIFCYPSMYPEGLPTSILEAGLMKTAVIATDRGGTTEVIIDPKYGTIIDENKESLKRALKDLIDHPEKIALQKSELHKRIISNFTWTTTATHVSQVLEETGHGKK